MNAELESMDLTYVARFTVPVFDLHVRAPGLLKAVHTNLSPDFAIRKSDMQIRNDTTLSAMLVSISFASRKDETEGKVDVRPEKIMIRFEDVTKWSQWVSSREFIARINRIIEETLSNPEIDSVLFDAFVSIRIRDEKNASELFADQITPKIRLSFDEATLGHGLYFHLFSANSREWHAQVKMSYFGGESPLLLVDSSIHYLAIHAVKDVDERVGHFKRLLESLFDQTGLEISVSH